MLATPQISNPVSLPRAALAAFMLEVAVVAAIVLAVASAATKPETDQTVPFTLSATTDAAPPKPPRPLVQPPVRHQPPRPHKIDPLPKPAAVVAATAPVTMPPRAVIPDPPSVPQEAVSARVAPDIQATFRSLIRAAIQAAAHDPYAARLAHLSGRVQVAFVYRDGRVSGVLIATSSGYEMIDNAARQAVVGAAYPAAPANLAGRDLSFKMWVHIFQTS